VKDLYFVSLAMHIYHSLCLGAYQHSAAYQYSTSWVFDSTSCTSSLAIHTLSAYFSPNKTTHTHIHTHTHSLSLSLSLSLSVPRCLWVLYLWLFCFSSILSQWVFYLRIFVSVSASCIISFRNTIYLK
jgi:hypothetical protein